MHGHRGFLIPVILLVILAATAALTPARAQTSIPDLSGIWGRCFNFEPPLSGPGPIVSKLRRPDGTIVQSVVGDFTNPILRPHAAEVVKKNGELELSGIVIPNPHAGTDPVRIEHSTRHANHTAEGRGHLAVPFGPSSTARAHEHTPFRAPGADLAG
jgi:hypothetical protein